ncbi:hypothetical protein KBY28_04720 [Ruegeria pomeroyi]|uniref:hypothetical protein n=1 Tax=Ruegeria pomeroyi TaxID=89184 RepID=UPI001F3BE05E|nr:hypothetical protein [Ruegeria pomeroyi]MCE8507751.1 hypothetical protein [Ruegeria pomeroyi]
MSIATASGLTAKDAIAKAKFFFRDFFSDQNVENVLLEELDFDDVSGNWRVTIGFDVGRKAVRQPSLNALAALTHQEVTPIREARVFEISDSDGSLVKMSNT